VTPSLENFIGTLARILDWHNLENGHGTRTATLSVAIGSKINGGERLSRNDLLLLGYAARIHDLGRAGVDNTIMAKSGNLTASQTAAMHEHCRIGYDWLKDSGLPPEITYTVLCHHEHWDGSGYPQGLKGLDIPLFSRIVCIADTYDGIVSERPYHKSRVSETALDLMNQNIQWFDPKLFAVFLRVLKEDRGLLEVV
jgi:HD-GYP domain-containing protein (c-di-GMP phosphodiesterase class II)